jgi:hypothetical protein
MCMPLGRTCPRLGRMSDLGNALASGGRASARIGSPPQRPGAARKSVRAAGKHWPGAADSVPHDVGGSAGLVTPRVARGEIFIFPYRGEGVFGWLERAPWHGAVKNVHAARPNVPAAWPNVGFGQRACLRGAGKRTDWQPPGAARKSVRAAGKHCPGAEDSVPHGAPWHGALKNVHAAGPNVPAAWPDV